MMGKEVLKVRPKRTELPAARPAVLARSFWEATSPTKAHPRLPTVGLISNSYTMVEGYLNSRATLKKDQTQATKMRKFFRASVLGTNPKIPTTNMVQVQTIVAMMTIRRRPNLSVRVIKQTEVTSAMTAAHVSCFHGLPSSSTYSGSL